MPVVTIPAPFGGQNNKDGALNLSPEFATSLVNWVPGPGYLDARGPCIAFSTNTTGRAIQCVWPNPNGGGIFATTNGELFAVASTIGAALTTAPTSGDFHGNTFQNRTILCNGVDTPQIYDGTAVVAGVYSGSGLTVANLYGSLTFKGRVYYWENNSRRFWYAAAGAFQGALSAFDLSTFTRGDGTLVSIAPLTFDGGSGPDDLIAFLFSNGEVLVYQGDDPGNTNSWQQVGAFRIGKMSGRSCWAVVGSSTLVATDLGVVDLARALSVGSMDDSATVGQQFGAVNMIPPGMNVTTRQLVFDPRNRILWLAIFQNSPIEFAQNMGALYGMDTESRAWFSTNRIAYGGGVVGEDGTATALAVLSNGLIFGATTSGQLVSGPAREGLIPTNDYFTGGALAYRATQILALDSPDRNKQCQGFAARMARTGATDTTPTPSMTYAVTGANVIAAPAFSQYQPSPQTRAMNPAAAYDTHISLSVELTSRSGYRWFSSGLMVRPGREV